MGRELASRAAAQRNGNGGNGQNGDGEPDGRVKTLAGQLERMIPEYQAAMPRGREATQLVRDATTCLRTIKNLDKCDPESFLGSLMTCAQLDLRPGVASLGHAWPLPYWDGYQKRYRAQLIVGYKGYIELGYRSGKLAGIASRIVYENELDDFEISFHEDGDKLVHKPSYRGLRGAPVCFYSVARIVGGGYSLTDPMSVEEMHQHRDKHAPRNAKGQIVGPWVDHFLPMGKKGLACDTPIPTPSGLTPMGNLSVGDTVFDKDGTPVRVWAVSEIKHKKCYRVTFSPGTSIVCDDEHFWVAKLGKDGHSQFHPYPITELAAAKAAGRAVTVPVAAPIDTESANLPLDPWFLGFWLGDGTTTEPHLTTQVDDLNEVVAAITSAGYTVGAIRRDPRSKAVGVGVRGVSKIMAGLGLLGHKHVPQIYLRGSVEQRTALLTGLMDSDGWGAGRSRAKVGFLNTNRELTDAVAELASSLGEVVCHWQREYTGYGKTVTAYGVTWTPTTVPFALSRKAQMVTSRQVRTYRRVASIEEIPSVPTRCIAVDSPSHTFLAGRDMIPTHNTMILRNFAMLPKSAEMLSALQVDNGVRVDLTPTADAGEVTEPAAGRIVAGQVEHEDSQGDEGEESRPERTSVTLTGAGPAARPAPAASAAPAGQSAEAESKEPGSAATSQVGKIESLYQNQLGFKRAEHGLTVGASEQIIGRDLTGPHEGQSHANLSEAEAVKLIDTLDGITDRDRLVEYLTAPAADAPGGAG